MAWRDEFDAAQTPQGAAFALRLGQLYNVTQPTFAIGELIYSDTTTTLASLAPNTAASKKFLSMTGTGSAGAAPVWETIEAADITDFSEAVDDRVDALIQDGTNLTWTYDDTANTLTGNVTRAALTRVDDTNVTLTLGGAPTTALLTATSITVGWSGELAVSRGGSGAGTLTGLLQGNGTSAFTTITNSTTVGQVLRVTGSNTYGWGALDLSDGDAITGDLPFANLAQGSALSVLGVTGNATADNASIAAGSDHQVLRRSGTSVAFGAVNLAEANAVTGALPLANQAGHVTTTTDNAAARYDGTGGNQQNSALIIADTTGAISRSGNGGIPVQGTNTNDSASSGYMGEIVEASLDSGSAVSLTTATAANITSISVPAGDWDIEAVANILPASTTSFTLRSASISETSATMDNTVGRFTFHPTPAEVPGANSFSLPITRVRKSFASTTTVYLVARCVFTVSTATAFGYISARRVR